jgi:hypothetical protein
MIGQVIKNDQDVFAVVPEVLGNAEAGKGGQINHTGRV